MRSVLLAFFFVWFAFAFDQDVVLTLLNKQGVKKFAPSGVGGDYMLIKGYTGDACSGKLVWVSFLTGFGDYPCSMPPEGVCLPAPYFSPVVSTMTSCVNKSDIPAVLASIPSEGWGSDVSYANSSSCDASAATLLSAYTSNTCFESISNSRMYMCTPQNSTYIFFPLEYTCNASVINPAFTWPADGKCKPDPQQPHTMRKRSCS